MSEAKNQRWREFASAAMAGLLVKYGWMHPPLLVAEKAAAYADAMVTEENKRDEQTDE